jgi:hypothetical protein
MSHPIRCPALLPLAGLLTGPSPCRNNPEYAAKLGEKMMNQMGGLGAAGAAGVGGGGFGAAGSAFGGKNRFA